MKNPILSFIAFVLFGILGALSHLNLAAQSNRISTIDLHRTLGPGYACHLYARPIQFFSETALVVMSSPSRNCYRSVDQLELDLISIDGHVLSHKHWPSTDPGIVISPGRLVVGTPDGLEVFDHELAPIESVALPRDKDTPNFTIEREGIEEEGTMSVQFRGRKLVYGGAPLKLLCESHTSPTRNVEWIFSFADGKQLVERDNSLAEEKNDSQVRTIASLDWVIPPCGKFEYCQAYDAGAHVQVSTGHKRRILVFSNGSRFPITDAAGLFPYFRLQVFDLGSGAELYREEDGFRTGERSASISPDGDLLAVFDGSTVSVYKLP